MPALNIGDTVTLYDATGDCLGEFRIEESRYGAWCGTFSPRPAYDRVRGLFDEFADLVNNQCFRLLDDVDEKISALGIWARLGEDRLEIHDVQIFDGSGSFRQVA